MGTKADLKEATYTKKHVMQLLMQELSPKIFRSVGSVGFTLVLEETEGFFEMSIYDAPLEKLDPKYKELRKQHIVISKRVEFEPFEFQELTHDEYASFCYYILNSLQEVLIGH